MVVLCVGCYGVDDRFLMRLAGRSLKVITIHEKTRAWSHPYFLLRLIDLSHPSTLFKTYEVNI